MTPTRTLAALIAATLSSSLGLLPAAHAKKKPLRVTPGVPMREQDIPPYVPPTLPDELPVEPSDIKVVEITAPEAMILMRAGGAPMVGNAIQGARLPVRGVVKNSARGCSSKLWYALEPFGYLCSREARVTTQPPSTEQVLKVPEGERLPFHYVIVVIPEGEKIPLWSSFDALKNGEEADRQLEHGDTIAIERGLKFDGESYWLSVEGKVLPQKGTSQMSGGSTWHGLPLTEATPLPFGWVTGEHVPVYDAIPEASGKAPAQGQLERRVRVQIVDEQTVGKKRWLKVHAVEPAATTATPTATDQWILADQVNEVRLLPHPEKVPTDIQKWIDVDLGEQVLVLYENDKPVYATLVSSGRAIPTPMGTYPVWAKVSAITMKNQPYEDKAYFVNKVPWSTFFQWHNAIHGAYWHDKFGITKSHGCVNVAPLDARYVFEWVSPPLPPGWTGLRPLDLLKSPYVVVRNSHGKKPFRQDRPIGPPDRALEEQRLVDAEKRRAEAAEKAAALPGTVATPP